MRAIIFFLIALLSIACTPSGSASDGPNPLLVAAQCSQKLGYHPCNFTLKDQRDKRVSLYDFRGEPFILDFSTMWCGPCMNAAADVQMVANRYGIHYITVLLEDRFFIDPDLEDAKAWADEYGIDEPVLQGSSDMVSPHPDLGWEVATLPTFYLINEEMKLVGIQEGYNQRVIDSSIEWLLGK